MLLGPNIILNFCVILKVNCNHAALENLGKPSESSPRKISPSSPKEIGLSYAIHIVSRFQKHGASFKSKE
jgi:hypothetical protein